MLCGIYRSSVQNTTVFLGVATMTKSAASWQDIKRELKDFSSAGLLAIIADLYKLNKTNQNFLRTRFLRSADALLPYKAAIRKAVCPDPGRNQRLRLAEGRQAIRDYKKALGDAEGLLELMVHFVECGNEFTRAYGDIDEPFYISVETVFENAVRLLLAEKNTALYDAFTPRLQAVVDMSDCVGWGYHESLERIFEEFEEAVAAAGTT